MSEIRVGLDRTWVVGASELLRTLRDPHVLAYLAAPLVMYPLLTWAASLWIAPAPGLSVFVDGPPEVVASLEEAGVPLVDASSRRDVEVHVASDGMTWSVDIEVNTLESSVEREVSRIRRVLWRTRRSAVLAWLEQEGHPRPAMLAQARRPGAPNRAARMASVGLGMVMVGAMLIAAVYPAIDMVVRERVGNTAETLLSTPVPRWSLWVGKAMACTVLTGGASLAHGGAVLLTLGRLTLTMPAHAEVPVLQPDPMQALLALPTLAATAMVVGTGMVFVIGHSRTFKGAEMLGTAATLAASVPVALAGVGLASEVLPASPWVPVGNAVLVVHRAALGELTEEAAVAATVVNLMIAVLALVLVARGPRAWHQDGLGTGP